jgi:hypothetical protein
VRAGLALAFFAFGYAARAEPGLADAEWKNGSAKLAETPDESPPPEKTAADLHPAERFRPIVISVFPGALIHGAGHSAAGKPKTANRLLAAEGVGFGTLLVGTGGLALTGASRYTVAPFVLLMIGGGSVFLLSWAADVYGVSVMEDERGTPLRVAPRIESAIGWRSVNDPQFRYRNFLVESFDLRIGRLRLQPSAWFALDDDNARTRLLAGWRLSGPRSDQPAVDGSFLDLEAAVTNHRFVSDGFQTKTAEIGAGVRYDLARFDRALAGTFVEGSAGFGLTSIEYDIPGMEVPSDLEQLFLARAGFGAYFGKGNGEVSFYYDHRHDDFAAGLQLTGLGSGVLGHFGTNARWFSESGFGFVAEAEVGSAYIFGASLAVRQGGAP